MNLVRLALALFLLLASNSLAAQDEAEPFQVCADVNFWAPFTFVVDEDVKGIHADLARRAFTALGIKAEITPMPWNRCMAGALAGYYDAVLSASFSEERAKDFLFPLTEDRKPDPRLRVTSAEYLVVVRREDWFDWQGFDEALPQPVGLPMGYSQVKLLRGKGVQVSTAVRYHDLFRMLHRGRINSLIVVASAAQLFLKELEYAESLIAIERPHRNTDYYLLVSRRGRMSAAMASKVWSTIAGLREIPKISETISRQAFADMDYCFSQPGQCVK